MHPICTPYIYTTYSFRYAFEWHTGDREGVAGDDGANNLNNTKGCSTKVDLFFDGEYVATNNVFVPTRGSRFNFGFWPGSKNWVGRAQGGWSEQFAYIAEVNVCPFNEELDAMYPQVYDQPFTNPPLWNAKTVPPAKAGLPGLTAQCPGDDLCSQGSDRPTGCTCGNNSRVCSTGCCDYLATPGADDGCVDAGGRGWKRVEEERKREMEPGVCCMRASGCCVGKTPGRDTDPPPCTRELLFDMPMFLI